MDYLEYVLIAILCLIVIYIVLRAIARKYKTNPFRYPYLYTFIDITGTRNPNIYDLIDQYLIDNGISRFIDYPKYVEIWKKENLQKANKAFFSKQRLEQYYSVIDDNRMFIFSLTKKTTKYTQKNYVRTSYKEDVIQGEYGFNLATIKQRYDELKKIDFVCTISEYNSN
ncbi:MAG: hypothetical protein J6U75_01660, partial [Clostridia bacterium]|nr:hypothetical protein [Clostridia bacterium]